MFFQGVMSIHQLSQHVFYDVTVNVRETSLKSIVIEAQPLMVEP
mgnify:CR=1 FL=1